MSQDHCIDVFNLAGIKEYQHRNRKNNLCIVILIVS